MRISRLKITQPRQNPAKASNDAATAIIITKDLGETGGSETEVGDRRGDRQGGPDPLSEALGRPRNQAFGAAQPGDEHPGDELAERAEGRSGQHPRHEAVGQHGHQPVLVERDDRRRQHHDAEGDQAGRHLVDRIREAEQLSHPAEAIPTNPIYQVGFWITPRAG